MNQGAWNIHLQMIFDFLCIYFFKSWMCKKYGFNYALWNDQVVLKAQIKALNNK